MVLNGAAGVSSSIPQQTRSWDPKEILKIIDEQSWSERDPHLRLDVKAIRDRRKTFKLATPSGTPERPSKQVRRETTKAICALTIWEGSGPEILVEDQVLCTITDQSDPVTGERRAKVDLEEPILVHPKRLALKGSRATTAIRFSMQITLQAATRRDKWPPVDLSNIPPPATKYINTDGGVDVFPFLVVSYPRLPHVPTKADEALLPVAAMQDFKPYQPKLSLEVDMNWVENATPLEVLKQKEKQKLKGQQQMTGRKRKQADSETITRMNVNVETTWEVRDQAVTVDEHLFRGYVCPLCNLREFDGADIYWFHLVQHHDIFKFRVRTTFPEQDDGDSLIRVKVKMDVKDALERKRDKNAERFSRVRVPNSDFGDEDIDILGPYKNFFDLNEYLKADAAQFGRKPDRRSHLNGIGRSNSGFDSPRASSAIPDMTRKSDAVPDLPVPKRRKFPVPPAPDGVTFFSLRVKRPLAAGEMLSESDDDIDDAWVLQKHSDRIETFKDLTRAEKRFLQRHDRHMLRERINSNLHYREALVRFCRANHRWLREPAMRVEFAKKLTSLQLEGVIKINHFFDYYKIIDNPPDQNDEGTQAHAESEEEEQRHAGFEPGSLHSFCLVCKKPIRLSKDLIRCSNPKCTNDYHIVCWQQTTCGRGSNARDLTLCAKCAPSTSIPIKQERDASAARASLGKKTASPELGMLDNFADDHLTQMPGQSLGPNDRSSHQTRDGSSTRPIGLDGSNQVAVQDSEGEETLTTPDLPVGHDRIRRRLSQEQPDRRHMLGLQAEYPSGGAHPTPRSQRVARDPGPPRSEVRVHEELARRITDDNAQQWMQERRITGQGIPRPRRPHEL